MYAGGLSISEIAHRTERQVCDLATLRFIVNGENAIFLGPPGVGKTHLAVALALEAVSQGIGTYFIATHALVSDLRRAHAENRLEQRLWVYLSLRLLLIDRLDLAPPLVGLFLFAGIHPSNAESSR